ncbi:hypothetical protein BC567DRAFT_239490 [Phyllosticta citribraziliensis]
MAPCPMHGASDVSGFVSALTLPELLQESPLHSGRSRSPADVQHVRNWLPSGGVCARRQGVGRQIDSRQRLRPAEPQETRTRYGV